MLPTDPNAADYCGTNVQVFPDLEPVARPGGPPISYVKPLVRMAGMTQDIPDFAVIGWQWIQPTPISYDPKIKVMYLGHNFINVPKLVRSTTQHANRMPRIDEAKDYAWHVDTSGPVGILYSSNGTSWHRIGSLDSDVLTKC